MASRLQGFGKYLSFFSGSMLAAITSASLLTFSSPSSAPVQAQTAGALKVTSDIQEANTETGIVTARGNVRIDFPARNIQGTAAQAQYFSAERTLVLSGNVYVLQDGNSMRAERMTYNLDEGRFVATPAASEQVESIYLVPEDEEPTPGSSNTQSAPAPEPVINLP